MKFLIVGLGNVGNEYDATRHNAGFDAVDVFVIKHGGSYALDRLAFKTEVKFKGRTFIVIKPTTFMNLSGKAVKYWMDKEKIPMENVLVLMDDLSLPLGTLRLRASGSAGGHNGLKSIDESLATDKYARLRIGIGNNFPKGMQVNFVLGKWNKAEIPVIQAALLKCPDVIESFALQGIAATMTAYNKG